MAVGDVDAATQSRNIILVLLGLFFAHNWPFRIQGVTEA